MTVDNPSNLFTMPGMHSCNKPVQAIIVLSLVIMLSCSALFKHHKCFSLNVRRLRVGMAMLAKTVVIVEMLTTVNRNVVWRMDTQPATALQGTTITKSLSNIK